MAAASMLSPRYQREVKEMTENMTTARKAMLDASNSIMTASGIERELRANNKLVADGGKVNELRQFAENVNASEKGSIFVIPTDTVYCVVCKPSTEGVDNLYKVKSRPAEKPVSLWIPSVSNLDEKYFDPALWRFMQTIWPGPVALVLNKGPWLDGILPDWKTIRAGTNDKGKADTIAVRVPNSVVCVELLKLVGPLVVTSANPSGKIDVFDHMDAMLQMALDKPEVKAVLHTFWAPAATYSSPEDSRSPASTVIDLVDFDETPENIREAHLTDAFKIGSLAKKRQDLRVNREGAEPSCRLQKWWKDILDNAQAAAPRDRSRSPKGRGKSAAASAAAAPGPGFPGWHHEPCKTAYDGLGATYAHYERDRRRREPITLEQAKRMVLRQGLVGFTRERTEVDGKARIRRLRTIDDVSLLQDSTDVDVYYYRPS